METATINGDTLHLPTFNYLRREMDADSAHRLACEVAKTKRVNDRIAGFLYDQTKRLYVVTLGLRDGGPVMATFEHMTDCRSFVSGFNAMIAETAS